jgi:hypothetical protein
MKQSGRSVKALYVFRRRRALLKKRLSIPRQYKIANFEFNFSYWKTA